MSQRGVSGIEVCGGKEVPEHLREMYEKACQHLDWGRSQKVKGNIICVLILSEIQGLEISLIFKVTQGQDLTYQGTFASPGAPLGRTSLVKHEIDTSDAVLINKPCRRLYRWLSAPG